MGDSFTGQKTQPTVSKYWRKKRYKSEENPEKANNTKYSNTINRHTYNPLSLQYYGATSGWLPICSSMGTKQHFTPITCCDRKVNRPITINFKDCGKTTWRTHL